MQRKKIVIITGASPSCNPRAVKEADCLSEAGFDVVILGACSDPALLLHDNKLVLHKKWKYQYIDFSPGTLKNVELRIKRKVSMFLFRYFGIVLPDLFGYGARRFYLLALEQRADLYIGHHETGLYVISRLIDKGFATKFDFEDWHSEDLLPSARIYRPIPKMKLLEAKVLHQAGYCTAASSAMADTLHDVYGGKKPVAVHNVFDPVSKDNIPQEPVCNGLSLVWFSQKIGPGRGLEDLFQALNRIDADFHLHLLGNLHGDNKRWLEQQFDKINNKQIHLYDFVPQDELVEWVSQFDIGLALDFPQNLNKDLTISNKLFTYLAAGVGVIACNTKGQKEIFSQNRGIGHLYEHGDIDLLATIIRDFSLEPDKVMQAKKAAYQLACEKYNWNRESQVLVSVVQKTLAGPTG